MAAMALKQEQNSNTKTQGFVGGIQLDSIMIY